MRGKSHRKEDVMRPMRLASMRPAHYAREVIRVQQRFEFMRVASMRPAHYAREVDLMTGNQPAELESFNEARALCAGSQHGSILISGMNIGFNEARALCAGSPPANIRGACGWMASMRPAHYAREVVL